MSACFEDLKGQVSLAGVGYRFFWPTPALSLTATCWCAGADELALAMP
jgi:hypothetical protein